MTPEQRKKEADDLYERARARLLEDKRERQERGEVVEDEDPPEPEGRIGK